MGTQTLGTIYVVVQISMHHGHSDLFNILQLIEQLIVTDFNFQFTILRGNSEVRCTNFGARYIDTSTDIYNAYLVYLLNSLFIYNYII